MQFMSNWYILIFGYTAYVFNKIKLKFKFALKTWIKYLIDYKKHHQYQIYNPVQ